MSQVQRRQTRKTAAGQTADGVTRTSDAKPKEKEAIPPAKERYFWVTWNAKVTKHDQELVKIWLNGIGRQWQREVRVIVPASYLEVADHSLIEQFTQEPGKPLKRRSPVKRFGYQLHEEASEKEYLDMLRKGTETRKKFLDTAARVPTD